MFRNDVICNGDAMKTVTTRITGEEMEWLNRMETETGIRRAEALRRLIDTGLQQWRRERALELLRDNRITVRKGAEMAGVPYVEMLEILARENISVGYDEKELERDIERFS